MVSGIYYGNMGVHRTITVELYGRRRCEAGGGGPRATYYVYTLGHFSGIRGASFLGAC